MATVSARKPWWVYDNPHFTTKVGSQTVWISVDKKYGNIHMARIMGDPTPDEAEALATKLVAAAQLSREVIAQRASSDAA